MHPLFWSSPLPPPRSPLRRFVAQLYKFMDDYGTPINSAPVVANRDLSLYRFFRLVQRMGGYNRITNQMKWRTVYVRMGFPNANSSSGSHKMKAAYKKYLHPFEEFHRKHGLAVTMESGRVTSHRYDRLVSSDVEAEAPEAAIFQGSGSCTREMNGSGSSKKILEAEAASFKKLEAEALHAEVEAEAIRIYRFHRGSWKRKRQKRLFFMEAETEAVNVK